MSVLGLICEYNPFHNGHLLHLNKSKENTSSKYAIVVMSGNYVQRGEPAIISKYARTKMALQCGADMVIELPLYSATSSAEYFANGAIKILNSLKIISKVCFGTEYDDLSLLNKITNILIDESAEFKSNLKEKLSLGSSYPHSRLNSISKIIGNEADILNSPNNILAIEYLKALKKLNSNILPFNIKREISDYNSESIYNKISSATGIRKSILENNIESIKHTMPINCYNILNFEIKNNFAPCTINNLSLILHFILKTKTKEDLANILDVTEGLENRIINKSSSHFYINDLLNAIKTKRYTYTKLKRAILHIILNITKNDFSTFQDNGGPCYIRVLGFRKENQFLLKELINNSSLPVITNLKNAHKVLNDYELSILQKEIESTDIYYLSKNNFKINLLNKNFEYSQALIII